MSENWGAFTLPMTRRHRSVQGNEQPARAALRAAVEVLGVPDYRHSLFEATLHHPQRLRSERPLAWVTQAEIHECWTAGSHPAPPSSPERSGRISRTVYEILQALGEIPEIDPPEVLDEIVDLSTRIEARLRAMSHGDEP